MSSTHECNPRTVWALRWQIWGKASRGVTSQRSEVTQLFLSCCGSDVSAGCLDCKLTGNQCHETPRKASRRKKQGPLKDIWLLSPTVNLFMCRSDTAFIYCIYLFGSWISPAVHLHSLAYNFCEVIGKMLLTFCAFYSSWGKKGSEILWLEYWTTVPFTKKVVFGKAFGAFSAFILHFDCLLLFHKNQYTHSTMKAYM